LFENFFGFKFKEPKSLSQINNQSLISLENIYPELKEFLEKKQNMNLLNV